jgi:hypothetical protein
MPSAANFHALYVIYEIFNTIYMYIYIQIPFCHFLSEDGELSPKYVADSTS